MVTDSRRFYIFCEIFDIDGFKWKHGTMVFGSKEHKVMKIKRKIHKKRIKAFIQTNSILHTSRCIARKEKTSMRYTFFDSAKFV